MTLTAPSWDEARSAAYAAASALPATEVPLADSDGLTLAAPLVTLTDLPAFPTSSVDGWAVRGPEPWRVAGRVLAGQVPQPLAPDTAVEIATGAMVPAAADRIVRVEDSQVTERDGERYVTGEARPVPDWRLPGEEAGKGEELIPAGTTVSPAVLGLAAACGYDTLSVHPAPRVAVLVFGDELLVRGTPGDGRVRDSLGPSLPAWLRRLGAVPVPRFAPLGPVEDTLDGHVEAIRSTLDEVDLVVTTGGTMHGPVDHLHPALAELNADYLVDTVKVRPGFPMMLAALPGGRWLAGLPGNPQSAVIALLTLVVPLLAGLRGEDPPVLPRVTLGADIPGRGDFTHLAIVRTEDDGRVYPLPHAGSSMLRGVARGIGFAVIRPGDTGATGSEVELVPVPLYPHQRPADGRSGT